VPISFTPTTWIDYPDITTPVSAAALNRLETAISALVSTVNGISVPEVVSNCAYWDEGLSEWSARPAVGSGKHVWWLSLLDAAAPAPPEAVAGDIWLRHPDSTFGA
jgi:hypothetical protein